MHAERKIMNTNRTLIILQYNIKNNKKNIMIFLLFDSIIRQYDMLIIQEF